MPFVGLGVHILLALFCAVHVVRNGGQLYWLIILFSFPLLGSLVYLLVFVVPHSRVERSAKRAVRAAGRAMDPGRELREARIAFDETPTAQNQMRLATALLEAGEAAQSAEQFQACLRGPFAKDLEIRLGAARAFLAAGQAAQALEHLASMRAEKADFRAEAVSLLTARSLAALDRTVEARADSNPPPSASAASKPGRNTRSGRWAAATTRPRSRCWRRSTRSARSGMRWRSS
ncbi:hypothetical protein ACFJIX_17270 [Roseateles sp. UC29_93]|uniref:hypothetical protein n=1 Tax=Roseateles sp. UC29_93 TaxID=3350177 RepID=UPI00366CAEB4